MTIAIWVELELALFKKELRECNFWSFFMAVPFDFADTATSDIWSYKKVLCYFLFSSSAKLDNIFNCQKWNYSFFQSSVHSLNL